MDIQIVLYPARQDIFGRSKSIAHVVVKMPAKDWHKAKKNNRLGMLYGVDISNKVYAMNRHIHATNPTVSDRARAKDGIKTIILTYPMINQPGLRAV